MRKFRSITSASDANLYVGPFGEIVVDDAGQLRIQDNVTAGGHLVVADTGEITFNGSTIATTNISDVITLNSNIVEVSNTLAVDNIDSIASNLTINVAGHLVVFDDLSAPGFNVGPGLIMKFDNVSSSNGPTLYTWYGEEGNPYDPPGQHSLDIIGGSNADIDYVEFASYNWDNYIGVDNTKAFIHTNWNGDPTQAWTFLKSGAVTLTPQGIINSFNSVSNIDITDSNVYISTVNQNTGSTFGILLENGNVTVSGNLVPSGNVVYDLGTPEHQWRHLYVSSNTIYIGGTPLTVNNGDLTVNGNPVGGSGLPTVVVPGELGTTYKGLQVSYGMIHSNSSQSELNVNKIVIYKPAITTTTIDPTSGQDDFAVSGLGNSDVLAMFVLYGDVNGPKALSTLRAFVEAAIDNVILNGGVEGNYNTVEQMKTAFYTNYSTLATAAGGLDQDFEFFDGNVLTTVGATTVQQGSGAVFDIADSGLGTYNASGIQNNGTNYLAGHKILVLGTALGGVTPDNDCIITVDSIFGNGEIFQWSVSGVAAGTEPAIYGAVTGINYQTGSGFSVGSINPNNFVVTVNNAGSNYVAGDLLDLPGSDLQNGVSPDNDVVVEILTVDGNGAALTWEYISGIIPGVWPANSIADGGNDQYDTGNFINSSLASQIAYNSGNTVTDGTAAFGAGSSYTFVYNVGIFGLLVTGNQSTLISTSGNSGADGNSTTEAGNIYGPNTAAQTFDNAVTHINIIGIQYAGPIVSFVKTDGGSEVDTLITDDGNGAGVGITRSNNQGIYNPYREGGWNSDISPDGTLWNIDGWNDLSNVTTRTYQSLYAAFGFGGLGNKIVGTECVMYLPDNGKYYIVKFSSWTQSNNGGGFSYTRRELDLNSLSDGVRFSDGTTLKSAEGVGRVKLQSPGNRRIEEVYGYNLVTFTAVTPGVTQNAVIRQDSNNWDFYVNATPELTQLYDNQNTFNYLEFSFDGGNTWVKVGFGGGQYGVYYQMVFEDNINRPVVADTVVPYRAVTGGTPVVWWNSADLPSGSSNFRGAVIDYHAFTGDGTIVGTIHIVDDDGEENITHTEVTSGSTNVENDDLWFVQNEGTVSYRRIDGAGRTLKVQWSAKVFYGSEIYD